MARLRMAALVAVAAALLGVVLAVCRRVTGWWAVASLVAAAGLPGCAGRQLLARPYNAAPLPPRTRVFLVAGGTEVANFAAEVVAQRRLWLDRGLTPDEIACYWARPGPAELRADRRQYRRLAAELRACYPASTAVLRAHLRQQAARPLPSLYLYITSHGDADIMPPDVPKDSLLPGERDLFDQYVIQMGAGLGRGAEPGPLAMAMRRGADPDDLVLSPRLLRGLLRAFPAATPKLVVLQACHSGGFLDAARAELRADAITDVPNLTAIASARFDRTSFGCESGAEMTYFGEIYTRLLTRSPAADPAAVDWPGLFTALAAEVAALERAVDVRPSLPVFFTRP
ncbi:hypothetical protein [Nannocystis sp.]|uniref:hypothetical protein n=1 Tax=Nannocystis sp. TaxID=1962667 RepID=UPI00242119BF|nr:hypothetical protein [Nannocystis sp.]MBK7827255.1 hypothetical protein [Nannocystis sp.]MBK9754666.1 hypothetical protein [Nannocystis sp.]